MFCQQEGLEEKRRLLDRLKSVCLTDSAEETCSAAATVSELEHETNDKDCQNTKEINENIRQ